LLPTIIAPSPGKILRTEFPLRQKALAIGFIAVVHFAYSLLVAVPIVRPDEHGYLMNAAALAGYRTDLLLPYFPGYSLFLVPAFLTGASLETVFTLVKIVNTVFFAGTFYLLIKLTERLEPNANPGKVLLAVVVVSFYPAFLAYNALALSENAFIFFFLLSLHVLKRLEDREVTAWLLFGVSVGMLYMIHPKSLPVLIAAFIVSGYLAWSGQKYKQWMLAILVFLALVYTTQELKQHIQEVLSIAEAQKAQHSYPSVQKKVDHLIDPVGIAHFFGNLTGQLLYLVVGTLGLAVFGLVYVIRKLFAANSENRHLYAYLSLAVIGTILMSAASHTTPGRLDHVLYGRYNEGVIAPILVLGLLSVSRRLIPWVLILIVAGVLAAGLSLFLDAYPKQLFGYVSMTAFYFYFFIFGKLHVFNPFWLVIVLVSIAAVWLIISRLRPDIGFAPFAFAFFLIVSALMGFELLFLNAQAEKLGTDVVVNHVARNIPEGTCINQDEGTQGSIKLYLYKVRLYKYPLLRMDRKGDQSLCSEWIISDDPNIPKKYPAAKIVVSEELTRTRLWKVPGSTFSSSTPENSGRKE
jgi:hypothetical protein